MLLRCQHCRKEYGPTEIKKVELRESFNRRAATWSAPKRICIRCLCKKPFAGNYRIAGMNVDRAVAAEGKRRRQVNRGLTKKQSDILDCIIKSIERHQRTPTDKELCQDLEIGTPAAIRYSVNALEKKGYLLRDGFTARGIRLNPKKYTVQVSKKK